MAQNIGRLSLRQEGKWWCAYYAREATLQGAVSISRMRMKPADQEPKLKAAFIELNKMIVDTAFAETQGQTPTWRDPTPAAEPQAEEPTPSMPTIPKTFHGAIARAWQSYKQTALAFAADELASRDSEMAFKAGSATLFWLLMKVLDPGDEPSDADLAKMDDLSREIEDFSKGFDQQWIERVKRGAP